VDFSIKVNGKFGATQSHSEKFHDNLAIGLEFHNVVRKEKTNSSLPHTEDSDPLHFSVEGLLHSRLMLFDDCEILSEGLCLILVVIPSLHQSV